MKKLNFVVFMMLLSTTVFADSFLDDMYDNAILEEVFDRRQTLFPFAPIRTSQGVIYGSMSYYGRNNGQRKANWANQFDHMVQTTRVSNGQWEAVRYMMNRYRHSAGDTYRFIITYYPRGRRQMPLDGVSIIVEFTSSREFIWWAFFDRTR
jgi:hypothetical protein